MSYEGMTSCRHCGRPAGSEFCGGKCAAGFARNRPVNRLASAWAVPPRPYRGFRLGVRRAERLGVVEYQAVALHAYSPRAEWTGRWLTDPTVARAELDSFRDEHEDDDVYPHGEQGHRA